MSVAGIMTRPVITVTTGTSVKEAARLMVGHRISGLPVINPEGSLVGIVSEGDFLRRVECGTERHRPRWLEFLIGPGRMAEEYVHAHGRRVEELMTREVVTIDEATPLADAVALMEEHRVKRLPVMRGDRIVGILSRSDLMRVLVAPAAEAADDAETDARIRDGLSAALAAQSWAPRSSLVATVRDGVVDLRGVVFDDRQRRALTVMAENIPGVRRVCDHLTWVEPHSGVILTPADDGAADLPAAAAPSAHGSGKP